MLHQAFGMGRSLSDTPGITFRIGAFQILSVAKIVSKNIWSYGNRMLIRYENWNGAIRSGRMET